MRVSESGQGFLGAETLAASGTAPSGLVVEAFESVPPAEAFGSCQQAPFFPAFPVDSAFSPEAGGLEDRSAPGPAMDDPGAGEELSWGEAWSLFDPTWVLAPSAWGLLQWEGFPLGSSVSSS